MLYFIQCCGSYLRCLSCKKLQCFKGKKKGDTVACKKCGPEFCCTSKLGDYRHKEAAVMYNNLVFIAGLTGNYGMGKSAVLQMFRELGAVTIDADRVVRQLLREKQVRKKIKTLLCAGLFDKKGALDRKKTAEKIFRNKSLRIKLEDILHPLVFDRIDDFFKKTKNRSKVFIVEAPLIFERGYESKFDKMITVFTNETTAINRLS